MWRRSSCHWTPISSATVRRVIYFLTSGKMKGRREVLEDKDEEEEENEVDDKVKEVRENSQLMHATW